MATYFVDDFSSLTGWTKRWNTTPTWTEANPLQIPNGVTNDWIGLTLDAVDSDADRDDVEILVKFTTPATINQQRILVLRGSGADESATHYHFSILASTHSIGVCNGSDSRTNLESFSATYTGSTTYWVRFRANGTTLQTRVWLDGDPEPGSPQINRTDTTISAGGWVGFSAASNITGATIHQIGIGTNGDAAPSSGTASHAATGALTAQSATVAGSAAAVTTFTSSGALTAQEATVAGTANHVVTHASSGVLEAQAATVAGSATRVVVHGSTGVLEAQAATVSGSADHSAAGAFSATGALSAQAATVAGSAAHLTLHTAAGALVADSATAAGSAVHYTLHTATGDLVADAASISGVALHEGDGAEVAKPFTGAGRPRKTRQRVVVEIDGEDFIAESPEEAQAILDQAKEAAEEKAKVAIERATKARNRPTRKVMADARKALELPAISAPDLGGYAEEISRQIEDIYRSAIQTIEVAALLRKRELEEEDDEDILMLL